MDAIWHLSNVFITLFLIKYCSKGSYSLLYGGLRRIEARKIRKIEEFWWKKQRTTEKWQPHSDEKSTKMKGLLRPQIFYAAVSKCVQSIWKQYRPLETILIFSRWSGKRTPTASQKQKQIELKILYFFRTNFQFKSFPAFFTFNRVCMIEPLLWIREKCVPSRNTDNYKVWNKFWVIGNLLRWTPFDIFQTYSSPFFDQILFKRHPQPAIWRFAAQRGQKNYEDRRILMK